MSVTRPRLTKSEAMRIEDKPADVFFLEEKIEPGAVAAFRQPKAGRFAAEGRNRSGSEPAAPRENPGVKAGTHASRRWR